MYGTALFKIGRTRAVLITESSVFRQIGITGVYVATNTGEVIFQPVKKGMTYKKNFITVLNGLNPGMTVITEGLDKIKAGSYVRPEFNK